MTGKNVKQIAAPQAADNGVDVSSYINAIVAQRNRAMDELARLQAIYNSKVPALEFEISRLKAEKPSK